MDLVLELVRDILAVLDTNILLDLLLGNSHGIGSSVPAIVKNVPFKLLAQAYFCCLELQRILMPVPAAVSPRAASNKQVFDTPYKI